MKKFLMEKRIFVASLILLFLVTFGLIFSFAFHKSIFSLIFFLGVSGLVGFSTNWLAIKMILNNIYLRLGFITIKLPGSGILPNNLEKTMSAISDFASRELLSSEAIRKELKEQGTIKKITDIIFRSLENEKIIFLLTSVIVSILEKKETHNIVKNTLEKIIGEKFLFKTAKFLHLIDGNEITWAVIDKLKMQVWELSKNHEKRDELIRMIDSFRDDFDENEISELMIDNIDTLLKTFDFKTTVKHRLGNYSFEQIQQLALGFGKPYFDWIVIWGGILGAIVGVIIWVLDFVLISH